MSKMFCKIIILSLEVNLLASVLIDDQPYCTLRYRRLCQGKGSHVACQFPVPGPGPSCVNYSQVHFTTDLKNFILHYINRRRQRIASGNEHVRGGTPVPKPEIMMLVNWDRELSQLAQRLADQCEFAHDECRATVRYPYAGQSVGEVRWRVPSDSEQLSIQRGIRRVFDAWWGERRRVQPEQLTAPFKLTSKRTVWGHFSQLAVWTLRAVGCGAVKHGNRHTRMLLVCDFSHTNMLGEKTINPGPVAPCPPHTVRRIRTPYPLLCAPVRRLSTTETVSYEELHYDENGEDGENGEYYHESPKTKSYLKANRRIISQNYKEMTKVHHKAYQSDDRLRSNLATQNLPSLYGNRITQQNEMVTSNLMQQVVTGKPNFGKLRIMSENLEDSKSKLFRTYEDDYQEFYLETTKQESMLRSRWKPMRKRPARPGANALTKKVPEKSLQRSSLSFLMLDEDDMDQFFRDTGFDFNWRKNSLQKD